MLFKLALVAVSLTAVVYGHTANVQNLNDGKHTSRLTFSNVVLDFENKNGQSISAANNLQFPGIIKVVSGTITFPDSARDPSGYYLQIDGYKRFFGIKTDLCGSLLKDICGAPLCKVLSGIFGGNPCAILKSGKSIDVTKLGNMNISIGKITGILHPVINGDWEVRFCVYDSKNENRLEGCLGITNQWLKVKAE